MKLIVLLLLISTLLLACSSSDNQAVISGEASYRERIALPPNAVFEASLLDVSLADTAAIEIGKVIIDPAGQVPISFAIPYDKAEIKSGHQYSLQAKVKVNQQLLFISDTMYPVFESEEQTTVKLNLVSVNKKPLVSENTAPFTLFPAHFVGVFAGANCDLHYQIDLFEAHYYFISTSCIKNGEPAQANPYDIGQWSFDSSSKKLTLKGGRESSLYFRVIDDANIEKLDLQGNNIISSSNLILSRSKSVQTLQPNKVFMTGMYEYRADSASFYDCATHIKVPLLFEGEQRELEASYLQQDLENRQAKKMHIEGSLLQLSVVDGEQKRTYLRVDRFIKALPEKECQKIR
jgi:copper homeostasis protein (lipoprotein)